MQESGVEIGGKLWHNMLSELVLALVESNYDRAAASRLLGESWRFTIYAISVLDRFLGDEVAKGDLTRVPAVAGCFFCNRQDVETRIYLDLFVQACEWCQGEYALNGDAEAVDHEDPGRSIVRKPIGKKLATVSSLEGLQVDLEELMSMRSIGKNISYAEAKRRASAKRRAELKQISDVPPLNVPATMTRVYSYADGCPEWILKKPVVETPTDGT